eukprot:5141701-Alexandrium_andersonii.AAC.1
MCIRDRKKDLPADTATAEKHWTRRRGKRGRRSFGALDVVAGAALPVREFRTQLESSAIEGSGAPGVIS